MNIIQVIPFKKTFKGAHLTYFTTQDVSIGNIVTFEIKSKLHQGFVIDVQPAESAKSSIRSATFSLKKIKSVYKHTIFNTALVQTLKDASDFYATSVGALSTTMVPQFVLENVRQFKIPYRDTIARKQSTEQYVIQEPDVERYSSYKRLIREEFAKKKSVLLVCPTIEDADYAYTELSKGIVEHSFLFASHIKKPDLVASWNKALKSDKPVLVVATGQYAFIPLSTIGSIVIERESSRSYKNFVMPYVDYRVILEIYARHLGARLVVGDLIVQLSTHIKMDQFTMHEYSPLKFRSLTTASSQVISMDKKEHSSGAGFSVFSDEMLQMIHTAHQESEHTLLLCSRKGLAPTIVCMDCGHIVACKNCKSPMVLHGKDATENSNYFLCHRCNEKRHAGELCVQCGSWRLHTLGVSTERVAQEVQEKFPHAEVLVFNSDTVKTQRQARKVMRYFYDTPGSILIGTEMTLLYLKEEIAHIGVVSIDSMFAIPDFSIHERILNMLLKAKALASKSFILQTRNASSPIIQYAHSGNIKEFIRNELKERKTYGYPPFTLMIKMTVQGNPDRVQEEVQHLKEYLKEYELFDYPILTQSTKGKVTHGILIRLDAHSWPQKALVEKLKAIPPYIKIVVQSDNIF